MNQDNAITLQHPVGVIHKCHLEGFSLQFAVGVVVGQGRYRQDDEQETMLCGNFANVPLSQGASGNYIKDGVDENP